MQKLRAQASVYLAVGLTAIGFVVIFLGWNGAAEKDFVAGQIPYVISGGLAGLGLVLSGLAMAVVEAHRRHTARILAKLDRLIEASDEGPASSDGQAKAKPAPKSKSSRRRRPSTAPGR